MDLEPELYPPRNFYHWGERPEALVNLERWVKGGSFHRYGQPSHEHEDYDRDVTPELKIAGDLVDGSMRWHVFYQRFGVAAAWGGGSGSSHPADVAYSALTLIEEHERQEWIERLVIGIA